MGEDLLQDPCQSNRADDIGGSDAAYIAAENGLECVGDQIQARRSGDFVIPGGKVVVAVLLCLWYVKDFVLGSRDEIVIPTWQVHGREHTRYGTGTVCSTDRDHQESGRPSRM